MIRSLDFYKGLILGLGIMYLFDPDQGKARRARVRDSGRRRLRSTRDYAAKASRDLGNRARGVAAQATARLHSDHPDDQALSERVRAKLGRYVSHPHAVDVDTRDGSVELRGPILREEVEDLISAVSSVRGVSEVINHLEAHAESDGIPELQGGSRHQRRRSAVAPAAWAPGVRLGAGVLGAVIVALGTVKVVNRVRSGRYASMLELEDEMPEYAMLR
jgi:hypothetical protein